MASVTDSTAAAAEEEDSIPPLDNVWKGPGIELFCVDGKKMMRCTTCPLDVSIADNNVWVKSATKLLAHKCGISGQGIRNARASARGIEWCLGSCCQKRLMLASSELKPVQLSPKTKQWKVSHNIKISLFTLSSINTSIVQTLVQEATTYGVSSFGDGATIVRKSSAILNMASEIAKRKRGNCI